jgi:multidrug efflux pump subunit AcrA (membrane-fusion protein)
MVEPSMIPPARRPELVVRAMDRPDVFVVKDPAANRYFQMAAEESFLLDQLDGRQTLEQIRTRFQTRFRSPLETEELLEFIELADSRGLLQPGHALSSHRDDKSDDARAAVQPVNHPIAPQATKDRQYPQPRRRRLIIMSLLYWRVSLFDPDRFLTWLESRLRFLWTRPVLLLCSAWILAGIVVSFLARIEFASLAAKSLTPPMVVLIWVSIVGMTAMHEIAHGLTCKHFGGEVRDMGVLLLFFIPCLYCDVSDTWLFPKKIERICVMLAGIWLELVIWSVGVIVWRIATPESFVHLIALAIVLSSGARILINLNPLIKLDGYYILSDLAGISNLRQRAFDRLFAWVRCLAWGALPPPAEPKSRLLVVFGLAAWTFSLALAVVFLWALAGWSGQRLGAIGFLVTIAIGVLVFRELFRGVFAGEVRKMIRTRYKQLTGLVAAVTVAVAVLAFVQIEDHVGGPFHVRSTVVNELRAPEAGFLAAVYFDEGECVPKDGLVARLEVPDLASRIAQQRAAAREAEAQLALLQAGTRPELLDRQRRRAKSAARRHDLARDRVVRAARALDNDLARLDHECAQWQAESEYSHEASRMFQVLRDKNSVSELQTRELQKQVQVSLARLEQAKAQKRALQALGTAKAEEELASSEHELAEADAELRLLEAGNRQEEIDAQRARVARLREELRHLEAVDARLALHSREAGTLVSPRFAERVGEYFRAGELICEIRQLSELEAEVTLDEQHVLRVQPGQRVRFKVRAAALDSFTGTVNRVAPIVATGSTQNTLSVYCRIEFPPGLLRPGMSGYARIYGERRPIGEILFERLAQLVRTEFWW